MWIWDILSRWYKKTIYLKNTNYVKTQNYKRFYTYINDIKEK